MKRCKTIAHFVLVIVGFAALLVFQNCSRPMQTIFNGSTESSQDQTSIVYEEPPLDEYENAEEYLTPQAIEGTCDRGDISLSSPLLGIQDRDWYVSAHFDQNQTSPDTRDYTGAINGSALTYDGHKGLDLAILNFAVMDTNVPVLAVADGVVESAIDGNYDRNTSKVAGAVANLVTVRHGNGFLVLYGHLKNGSVHVVRNQIVRRGDLIGYIGSSGQSSGPHLHLDVKDCNGQKLDLLRNGFFENPPGYFLARKHFGSFLRTSGAFSSGADVLNVSGESIRGAKAGVRVYYAASYLNIRNFDVISEKFYKPSGALAFERSVTVNGGRNVYSRFNKWNSFVLSEKGTWTIRHTVNNTRVGADLSFYVN